MTIQAISNHNTSFRGKVAITENGAEYYKTNNGLKVGAVFGAINGVPGMFAGSPIAGLATMGIHSGVGYFMDYKRNKNAAEAADYIKAVGVKNALRTRDDIFLSTKNGKPYYKSNVGVKYGTAIGAGYGALISFLPTTILAAAGLGRLRSKEVAIGGVVLFGVLTSISALGGFILGKITDYYTNKAAEKNA